MLPQYQRFDTFEDFRANYAVNVPPAYNFAFDFLDAQAAQDPERPAMVHVGPDGARRELNLAFFSKGSSRMAHAFKAMGLGKGDKVMIVLQRRVEFWLAVLALQKVGAVPVPSPHLLTAHDVEYRVNKAGIKACVVEEDFMERVDAVAAACPSLKCFVRVGARSAEGRWLAWEALENAHPDAFPRPERAAGGEDVSFIFFSSGTTGMPKMVVHNHNYPLGHITTGVHWHDLRPGDLHLTVADTGWGKSIWGKFFGQWMAGACVFTWDYRGKFVPAELLDVISKHGVTTFCAPPTIYRFLIRENLADWDLSRLRHCTTAGELLNEGVFHAWKKATGLTIFEGYGQTETTLQIAAFPNMPVKPGSIGKPCPGWDIVLLDVKGRVCAPGDEGEICIRLGDGKTVGLFDGYLYEPEKTASVMFGGYYHTGDKAWMDEDGYFWFLGRNDDLIKSSGYRIGPFEVESALITHEAVVEAAVTGVPDAERGQAVKATVVLASGYSPSPALVKELQDHVKRVTAPYKYPRVVEFVAELPKTISGKIKRAEIRAKDEGKTSEPTL
ncbi:Acetyl-coenzyme A synthetase [Fundidesulfovibrio magnetotacticus]|uniref:Acetyl-coenzyme A synthetase n=1 Tax=Fundidesulfovibrio magnetotacticus TaxID=2730080 RepID=A0A6V8LQ79_9BACT|nr:AMP-binding protein [Fundidesulfovibrio magnetotacticus]GFK92279.1 Acetyl-coenzyme A synthetase [Fundidesulfovibrio magnetotacticus]